MMGPFRRLAHLIDQGRQLDAALAGDPFALPAPEDRYSVRQLHGLYPRRHPGLYAPLLGSLALLLGAAPLGLAALRLALPEAPLRPLGWLSALPLLAAWLWLIALLSRGASLGPRLARDASLLLVATGLLLRLASGETSGLVALGGGACTAPSRPTAPVRRSGAWPTRPPTANASDASAPGDPEPDCRPATFCALAGAADLQARQRNMGLA